jgi:spermidine synthase
MKIFSFLELKETPDEQINWPLFFVSFASLYIEVLLIRWIGTEVRVFAYFQNLALIACFLGFGVGCYRSKEKKTNLFNSAALGSLVILVGLPFVPWQHALEVISSLLSFSPYTQTWAAVPADNQPLVRPFLLSAALISILLLLVVRTMIPLGQWVGAYLGAARNPISAYSTNLLGSLAGIWFFAGLSFFGLAPVFWFAIAMLLLLLMRPRLVRSLQPGSVLLGCGIVLLAYAALRNGQVQWSPYQKLEVQPLPNKQFNVLVNNTGYMTIANLSAERLAADPFLAENYRNSSYDTPFRLTGERARVLIVGAGAGNDVDAALRNGASQVDAVEIDPVIYALGKRLHPDHPYDSPRAHIFINDARAFFRQAKDKYDVVVFGLLDSHTEFSGYSNMRVDSYVYTEESLAEAKRLLKPSGVLIVKFEVRAPATWMGQRFYAMFDRLFGRPPVAFYVPALGPFLSATEFVASNDPGAWERAEKPEFAAMIQKNPPPFSLDLREAPALTTDDWPYIYHRSHTIPRAYLTISLILLAIAFVLTRRALEPRKASTWNFFFLGAGFLLLETQIVSRLALYFGATWWVNCIALSMILAVLVAATFCVDRGWARTNKQFPLLPWYAGLISSVLAIYFVPWELLPYGTLTVGSLFGAAYCVPVFCAGVIFAETFRQCADRSACFGSNIIGAVAGGLAQNLSFIIGMKALLLLTAVFYLFAAGFGALSAEPLAEVKSTFRFRRPDAVNT